MWIQFVTRHRDDLHRELKASFDAFPMLKGVMERACINHRYHHKSNGYKMKAPQCQFIVVVVCCCCCCCCCFGFPVGLEGPVSRCLFKNLSSCFCNSRSRSIAATCRRCFRKTDFSHKIDGSLL